MLLNFLFLNLFLHVILFAWMKVGSIVRFTYIYRLALISLIFALISGIYDVYLFQDDLAITLYNNTLRLNQAVLAQQTFIIFLALILLIVYYDTHFKPEFFLILFTNLISASLLLESYNFIVFFISWEIFNLSLYTMIVGNGIYKQEALAASMKYFLLSAFSTTFLLLGLALLYYTTGSLEFETIYIAMSTQSIDLPIILIIFALLFKVGAAPLHFWAPDLYDNVPLPIAAYISNLPKVLYLFVILDLMDFLVCQSNFFIIAGFISLLVGSLGLSQSFNIKRFLAYSAITNLGYFLIMIKSPGLVIFNMVLYILPVINIFIILMAANKYYEKDIQNINHLKGFFMVNPFFTFAFILSIFSIAGIPPLPGFYAKYNLLTIAFQNFPLHYFSIIILTTVIAVANYLRILNTILFTEHPFIQTSNNSPNPIFTMIVSLNLIIIILLSSFDILTIFINSIGYTI